MDPVRFSHLKWMARSPQHYLGATVERTGAIQIGSAVHSLLLGGPSVVAYPGKVRRGKAWDAFRSANAGAVFLSRAELGKAEAMAESVRANRQAMSVLDGVHEHPIDWRYLGRACRSTLDVLGLDGEYITELKTGATSDPVRFSWQSMRMHYDAQLAFYDEAVRASGLGTPRAHYVVAVESSPPYVVTTFRLTDRALERGRRSFRLWFERLLLCEAENAWPGYCESIVDLDVPDDEPDLVFGDDSEEAAA